MNVSLVIPVYNADDTFERSLRSALNARMIDEVVVVDDGSESNAAQKIVEDAYNPGKVAVTFIRQANQGAAAARNAGIMASHGKWIGFLDADDDILPDGIEIRFEHLGKCPEPDLVSGVYGSFIQGDTGTVHPFSETSSTVDPDRIGRLHGFPGGCHTFLLRRTVLESVGGFDTKLRAFEDFDLLLRLLKADARLVGCEKPCFVRHYTPHSLTRANTSLTRSREREFLDKAWRMNLMSKSEITRRYMRSIMRGVQSAAFPVKRKSVQ